MVNLKRYYFHSEQIGAQIRYSDSKVLNYLRFHLMSQKLLFIFTLIYCTSVLTMAQEKKTILIFGDSITAGYGLEKDQAFPAILQEKIDSVGLNYEVINGGLSGETSAGGARRINWVLQRKVDLMILELGGNDGLRGIDLTSTKQNLQTIIDRALEKNPDMEIIIAGMQVPPNLGIEYTRVRESLPRSCKRKQLTADSDDLRQSWRLR